MPDLEQIQDSIHARLEELERLMAPLRLEERQLKQAADGFGAAATARTRSSAARPGRSRTARASRSRPSRSRTSAEGARPGRPAGGGKRAQQALARIHAQPGISAPELAKSMGIGANYLYRVLPRLEREGKLVKQGRGYHPAGEPGPVPSTPAPAEDA